MSDVNDRTTLDYWMDEIGVMDKTNWRCDQWWPESLPYAVIHPDVGFIGLFPSQRAAFQYRLFIINEELNSKFIINKRFIINEELNSKKGGAK